MITEPLSQDAYIRPPAMQPYSGRGLDLGPLQPADVSHAQASWYPPATSSRAASPGPARAGHDVWDIAPYSEHGPATPRRGGGAGPLDRDVSPSERSTEIMRRANDLHERLKRSTAAAEDHLLAQHTRSLGEVRRLTQQHASCEGRLAACEATCAELRRHAQQEAAAAQAAQQRLTHEGSEVEELRRKLQRCEEASRNERQSSALARSEGAEHREALAQLRATRAREQARSTHLESLLAEAIADDSRHREEHASNAQRVRHAECEAQEAWRHAQQHRDFHRLEIEKHESRASELETALQRAHLSINQLHKNSAGEVAGVTDRIDRLERLVSQANSLNEAHLQENARLLKQLAAAEERLARYEHDPRFQEGDHRSTSFSPSTTVSNPTPTTVDASPPARVQLDCRQPPPQPQWQQQQQSQQPQVSRGSARARVDRSPEPGSDRSTAQPPVTSSSNNNNNSNSSIPARYAPLERARLGTAPRDSPSLGTEATIGAVARVKPGEGGDSPGSPTPTPQAAPEEDIFLDPPTGNSSVTVPARHSVGRYGPPSWALKSAALFGGTPLRGDPGAASSQQGQGEVPPLVGHEQQLQVGRWRRDVGASSASCSRGAVVEDAQGGLEPAGTAAGASRDYIGSSSNNISASASSSKAVNRHLNYEDDGGEAALLAASAAVVATTQGSVPLFWNQPTEPLATKQ
mmetsp:Transcript_50555/g.109086  ORF Transcript_50555/g.109086 Transcript_50555/m.109086 type:complete len:692 (+) Transcript_50555:103-2178(+)